MKPIYTKSSMTSQQRTAFDRLLQAECEKAIKRIQYIMILAIADEFGIGKKRMSRWLDRYMQYVDDYQVFKMDDAGDEILLSRIRRRGFGDVYKL